MAAAEPPAWIMAGLIAAMALAAVWLAGTLLTGRGVHDRVVDAVMVGIPPKESLRFTRLGGDRA